jgi:glycosyltransferase involved in cell wall biosynthesis
MRVDELKNVIYLIQGMQPSLSSGGPFRIVAMLLDELLEKTDDIDVSMITKDGVLHSEDLLEFYRPFNVAQVKKKSYFSKMKKKIYDDCLSEQFKLYLNILYNEKNVHKYWNSYVRYKYKCILHSHLNTGASKILAVRNKCSQKVIVTYHSKGSIVSDYSGSWNLNKKSAFAKDLESREKYEIQNADVITFPSKGAFELMKADYDFDVFAGRDVRIVYNGVDIALIDNVLKDHTSTYTDGKPFTILNVAQHVSQKRFDLLLHAVAILKKSINIKLINVGDGLLLEKNVKLAQELNISDVVEFKGRCANKQVLKLMSDSDVFVMPSENVVFDLITLEAMAAGIPVVVSADGGNFECIRDGVDGILTPVGDVESVVRTIRMINQNPEKLIELKHSARKRVEKDFSTKAMAANYKLIYEEIYPHCESTNTFTSY